MGSACHKQHDEHAPLLMRAGRDSDVGFLVRVQPTFFLSIEPNLKHDGLVNANGASSHHMLKLIVIRARDIDRLGKFYQTLGLQFTKHRHGSGPEHLSANVGETVFEIYPAASPNDSTTSTRLGFSVFSLSDTINKLEQMQVTIVSKPAQTPFGLRAVVQDFEGHKVELYDT